MNSSINNSSLQWEISNFSKNLCSVASPTPAFWLNRQKLKFIFPFPLCLSSWVFSSCMSSIAQNMDCCLWESTQKNRILGRLRSWLSRLLHFNFTWEIKDADAEPGNKIRSLPLACFPFRPPFYPEGEEKVSFWTFSSPIPYINGAEMKLWQNKTKHTSDDKTVFFECKTLK